jgi:hypothetical protein
MKIIYKYSILFFTIFFCCHSFTIQNKISAKDVITKMHKRYAGKWYKNVTFSQTTENYKNDSLIKTTDWHETIVFPNYFRITFGEPKNGNAIIYKFDSSFQFKNSKLIKRDLRTDDITLLIGGIYFMPLDTAIMKIKKEGFDISKVHESMWQGKKVYVIGSNSDDEKLSQLWIDKEKLVVVRFIKYLPTMKQEAIMNNHKKMDKAWMETEVIFNLNDKLYQKEKYYNQKANTNVDMEVFNLNNFKE